MKQGWGWPWNARKEHYFRENVGICGRWMFFGYDEKYEPAERDRCKTCQKILEREKDVKRDN